MKNRKRHKIVVWLLVFAIVCSMGGAGIPLEVMAKSQKADTIDSISLKIGKKSVAKKTYRMKQGNKKKIVVDVSPYKGTVSVTFTTSNRRVAVVSKNGTITAKKAGTARIKVTVEADGGKKEIKTTWMKVRITKPSNTDENTGKEPPEPSDPTADRKSIVVYFSCTENTRRVAELIQEGMAADIYRIEPSVPYTSEDLNYGNPDSRTSKENRDAAARPEISGGLPDLDEYEVVFLGYPIWHGQAPKILYTFVESYDWSGKTVIPFCTSASSGIGKSGDNLARQAGGGTWLAGRRFDGSIPESELREWLDD